MENGMIQKNSILQVEFIDLTYAGLGVAKHNGFAIFVEGALPSEKATVRITKVEKRFAYGELIALQTTSDCRVEAVNTLLDSTIPLQHLRYDRQLVFKSKIVKDIFSKSEIFKDVIVKDTIGAKEPWYYRNKTQVPVRSNHGKMETGVFVKGTHQITPVEDFKINLPGIDEMVAGVRDILISFHEKPYDEKTHTGNIRHIIVRKGYHTNEMMCIIVTRSKSLFPKSKIIPAIIEKFPNTVSIVHNINNKKGSHILGDTSEVMHGKASYCEEILGISFDVAASSFLQVNTPQAEVLYTKVLELLALKGNEVVLDAYCGIGTISLSLAAQAKQVIGIEVMKEAVEIAKVNARKNQIDNISFSCGLVEEVVSNLHIVPDVVVLDPPRKGIDASFIDYLVTLNPQKIVYISCNPATLVRDLKPCIESGYTVSEVQPLDMFPQTTHVETITLLCRR
jgi:23S rRNA (uracil-5-)-methyltransferase RumA